jgi:chloramphenicol 3-O phosphotransferase
MGIVIFLNGASSSGKTSIARELQARWETPLLLFGIDDVISMMPFKYTGDGPEAHNGFFLEVSPDSIGFDPGPDGYKLNDLSAGFVADLANESFDVVLDYVLEEGFLEAFMRRLSKTRVLFCGVFCDIKELEIREAVRGDRVAGLARRQANSVHFCRGLYDLELDSSSTPAAELAMKIIEHLDVSAASLGFNRGDLANKD